MLRKKKRILLPKKESVSYNGPQKTLYTDTNVMLHDSSCIYQFDEHDIVIPITVLEELEKFKKGNGTLNFHARETLRALDSLSEDRIFNGGLPIGPGKGKISIKLDREFHKDLSVNFNPGYPDHAYLTLFIFLPDNSAPVR